MASVKENTKFTKEVLGEWPLDAAIDWIAAHLEPDDVFSDDQLREWVSENS